MRQGRWKLVSRHPGRWELYDMDADRSELHDLVDAYPDKVRELAGVYDVWAARCGVVDWDALQARRRNRR